MLSKAKKGVRSLSMYDFFLILLGNLWNLPSAVFVGLSLLGFAFTCSFRKHSLTLIADLAYPVGLLGLTIGLVGLLQNISNYEALPKALAMALIPLIYAAIGHGIAWSGRSTKSDVYNSPIRKVVGTIVFLVLTLWAAHVSAGLQVFILLDALAFTFVGIFGLICTDRLLKRQDVVGWTQRLLGIALICFVCGLIGMLANLDERRAIGPAAALALLGLFYALILVVIGRIWFPKKMLDGNNFNGTGLLTLVLPVLFGVIALSGLLASTTFYNY